MKFLGQLVLAGLISLFTTAVVAEETDAASQISRDEAAQIARDHFDGKLLDIRAREEGKNSEYRVKMLREGRVRVFKINGNTGEVSD